MNTETEQAIAEAVRAEIATTPAYRFELVYIDYRDGFTAEQVAALARGDWEQLDGLTDDWIGDAQHLGAWELLNELVGYVEDADDGWDRSVLQEWLHTEEAGEILLEIMERDTSNPLRDLARQSGNVLLRVRAQDGYVEDDDEAEIHYWIAAVNVIDLYEIWLTDCERVRLTKACPWRGDTLNGGGMVDDEHPVEIEVARADLRTDADAPGYSWTETAYPIISYYESKIEAVREAA